MDVVFADTNYWVAKIFPHDQWHGRVIEVEYEIGLVHLVTSDSVLIETLNYFSEFRSDVKETAHLVAKTILNSAEVDVVRQAAEVFQNGWKLPTKGTKSAKMFGSFGCFSSGILGGAEAITDSKLGSITRQREI